VALNVNLDVNWMSTPIGVRSPPIRISHDTLSHKNDDGEDSEGEALMELRVRTL
jgi:hypothetical protein